MGSNLFKGPFGEAYVFLEYPSMETVNTDLFVAPSLAKCACAGLWPVFGSGFGFSVCGLGSWVGEF